MNIAIKNVRFFRMTDAKTSNQLIEALKQRGFEDYLFRPCSEQALESFGFAETIGNDIIVELSNLTALSVLFQNRILPTEVINKAVQEKVQEIELKEGRKVYKKEKQATKEDVIFELTPQAFTKDKKVLVWFDWERELLCIANASSAQTDKTLALLREVLGSLPVVIASTKGIFGQVVANKLLKEQSFVGDYDDFIKLFFDNQNVTIKGQEIPNDELISHLKNGLFVKEIKLNFPEKLTAKITKDLDFKSIDFAYEIAEQLEEYENQQDYDRASFLLCANALGDVFLSLVDALGGYSE